MDHHFGWGFLYLWDHWVLLSPTVILVVCRLDIVGYVFKHLVQLRVPIALVPFLECTLIVRLLNYLLTCDMRFLWKGGKQLVIIDSWRFLLFILILCNVGWELVCWRFRIEHLYFKGLITLLLRLLSVAHKDMIMTSEVRIHLRCLHVLLVWVLDILLDLDRASLQRIIQELIRFVGRSWLVLVPACFCRNWRCPTILEEVLHNDTSIKHFLVCG